jgi:hypothetical protein
VHADAAINKLPALPCLFFSMKVAVSTAVLVQERVGAAEADKEAILPAAQLFRFN